MDYKGGNYVIIGFAAALLIIMLLTIHPINNETIQKMILKEIILDKYKTSAVMFRSGFIKDCITPLIIEMYEPYNVITFIMVRQFNNLPMKQVAIRNKIDQRLSAEFDNMLGPDTKMCNPDGCDL